jgi:predicted ATPase/DNA-binding XRE family transcriptional regulator
VLDPFENRGFGELLRQRRLAAGLTQATLGERAGIAERTIQDLERGAAQPRRATVRRLAAALALPPADRAAFEAVSPSPRRRGGPAESILGQEGTAEGCPGRLPIPPTALLGRERELAEIQTLVRAGARLVTLTGPGGVGKTRLAVQAAAALQDGLAHGVFLVDLAPIGDPALVPTAVAQVLGVRDLGGRPMLDGLKEYLRNRSILLVLDNLEQVLPAASVVAELLAVSPGLRTIATSREPLRLRGEHEYQVRPLALPDARQAPSAEWLAEYASVALFVERAREINAELTLTPENAPAIATICARLDGLPLAIELASARTRLLSPQAMVGRLEQRLPLLTGGSRDLPARQQTLRNTIAWSYDLLSEDERRLFRRLAVFAGGWSLEAAEAIVGAGCQDVGAADISAAERSGFGGSGNPTAEIRNPAPETLDLLESLAAKSLVRLSDDPGGEPRFVMLETIREFALEELEASGEAARVRRCHAEHVVTVAERAAPMLRSAGLGTWLHRLEAEHDNFRAALRWIVEQDEAVLGLRLGGALSHFWDVRGYHTEARDHLTSVLRLPGAQAEPALRATVLCDLGFLALDQGDYTGARALYEESRSVMQTLGDRRGVARALLGLAWTASDEGDHATGRALHEEGLAIMRALDDRRGTALALTGLGHVATVAGDHATARACHEESLALVQELGDRRNTARSLIHLGWSCIYRRDYAGAGQFLSQSLAILRELGDARATVDGLELAVSLVLAAGEMADAARFMAAGEALRETLGAPLSPTERDGYAADLAAVKAGLGQSAFEAAWAEGCALSSEESISAALAWLRTFAAASRCPADDSGG